MAGSLAGLSGGNYTIRKNGNAHHSENALFIIIKLYGSSPKEMYRRATTAIRNMPGSALLVGGTHLTKQCLGLGEDDRPSEVQAYMSFWWLG